VPSGLDSQSFSRPGACRETPRHRSAGRARPHKKDKAGAPAARANPEADDARANAAPASSARRPHNTPRSRRPHQTTEARGRAGRGHTTDGPPPERPDRGRPGHRGPPAPAPFAGRARRRKGALAPAAGAGHQEAGHRAAVGSDPSRIFPCRPAASSLHYPRHVTTSLLHCPCYLSALSARERGQFFALTPLRIRSLYTPFL